LTFCRPRSSAAFAPHPRPVGAAAVRILLESGRALRNRSGEIVRTVR
jgi:hypothetical protein